MKKHRPVNHAHRKPLIREKWAKGKHTRSQVPTVKKCSSMNCENCWAYRTKYCR